MKVRIAESGTLRRNRRTKDRAPTSFWLIRQLSSHQLVNQGTDAIDGRVKTVQLTGPTKRRVPLLGLMETFSYR